MESPDDLRRGFYIGFARILSSSLLHLLSFFEKVWFVSSRATESSDKPKSFHPLLEVGRLGTVPSDFSSYNDGRRVSDLGAHLGHLLRHGSRPPP